MIDFFILQKQSSLLLNPHVAVTVLRPVVKALQEDLPLAQYAKNQCAVIKADARSNMAPVLWTVNTIDY